MTPQAMQVGLYDNHGTIPLEEITLCSKHRYLDLFTASKEYESESFDRSSMGLSALQSQLIDVVSKQAASIIIVNPTSSLITMP
ncbi:hypothetical protein BJX99DRAFT_137952 [Aspergillus californicus]